MSLERRSNLWGSIGDLLVRTRRLEAVLATANVNLNPALLIKVAGDFDGLTVGDGKITVCIPRDMDGATLVQADAFVSKVSTSGAVTVQVRNVTQAVDMLTTRITIDANEFTSITAATQPVIDLANDDVAEGDLIAIDLDVAGTGARGLGVMLEFSL